MKRTLIVLLLVNLMLSACAPASAPTPTPAPSATPLPTTIVTPIITATLSLPSATPMPSNLSQDNDRNVPIVVAIITSVSALIGAILSAILSFSTQRRLQKLEAKKITIEFLMEKKRVLEDAQNRLKAKVKEGRPLTSAENIGLNLADWFDFYSSVFDSIKHLLSRDVSDKLQSQQSEVNSIMGQMLGSRLVGDNIHFTKENVTKSLELRAAFINDFDKAIAKELRDTIEEINRI